MQTFEYDVLVVGGGTAGFGAAVTAGRLGLSVGLLEATGKIGGVMAFCPGMPWGGGYPQNRSIGGLFEELCERLLQRDAAELRPCTLENFGPELLYDVDQATLVMHDMLLEAGVALHLNTLAHEVSVSQSGNSPKIQEISAFGRLGSLRFQSRQVIDCSGDAEVSTKAGVAYELGDSKGNMMGATLSFHMMNAPWEKVFAAGDPYFQDYAAKGIAEGRLHPDLSKLYLMKAFRKDSVFCNTVVMRGVDGRDPRAISEATQEGRRRCKQVADFLIDEVPGFENAYMSQLGPNVGIRETRRLQAITRIKGTDLAAGRKFADGIVACDNPIDDVMRADDRMTHDAAVGGGDYYTIPLSAMIPKTVSNLMFAGRLICADSTAFASVRGMPQCMSMGQACAVAVFQALDSRTSVQKVDRAQVVETLQKMGVNRI